MTFHIPARRLILAGGFAVAIAIAPTVAVFASPGAGTGTTGSSSIADPCQPGIDGCPVDVTGAPPDVYTQGPDSLPEIDGIPCNGNNTGTASA